MGGGCVAIVQVGTCEQPKGSLNRKTPGKNKRISLQHQTETHKAKNQNMPTSKRRTGPTQAKTKIVQICAIHNAIELCKFLYTRGQNVHNL